MTAISFTDQMGFEVKLDSQPRRIVSLVPSQTELLFDLGLDREVVGVTKFCIHPEHARKTRATIGGTKKFDLDLIASLNPDLIIGNKEENYPEGINFLRERYPVWMSDIYTLEDAMEMMGSVSRLTAQQARGERMVAEIKSGFNQITPLPQLRALYLMWHNPWMGAASRTFIHDMMTRLGLVNVLADRERYPELDEKALTDLKPDIVLLSSEPFPFAAKHLSAIRGLLPEARVLPVDGELFSWYGSRLRKVPAYSAQLNDKLNRR